MACSLVLIAQYVEAESKLEEQEPAENEAQLQEEDFCLFINDRQQSVNDADCSKICIRIVGEGVPSVLHQLAEFKAHHNEEIVAITDDGGFNLNETDMQSPTQLESKIAWTSK